MYDGSSKQPVSGGGSGGGGSDGGDGGGDGGDGGDGGGDGGAHFGMSQNSHRLAGSVV